MGVTTSGGAGYGIYSRGRAGVDGNLEVDGSVRITDGTEGNGYVLTSDASGNASWQGPVSIKGYGVSATIVPSTFTAITNWATIEYEEGGSNYNVGTGEYTIPVSGLYSVEANVVYNATSSNGYAVVGMRINGNNSTIEYGLDQVFTTANFSGGTFKTTKQFTAGDIVQIVFFNSSASNITISNFSGSDARSTRFAINLLHR
jgi:hypothetical protein